MKEGAICSYSVLPVNLALLLQLSYSKVPFLKDPTIFCSSYQFQSAKTFRGESVFASHFQKHQIAALA